MRSIPRLLSLSGLLLYTLTVSAQQPQPMPTHTLFASAADTPTQLSHSVCTPLSALEATDTSTHTYLVLQQVHAHTAASAGPFVVYLEPLNTPHHLPAHKVGTFSLYSLQMRSDAQDISLPVPHALLHHLLSSHQQLQVCIENANHALIDAAASATVSRILLVRPHGI